MITLINLTKDIFTDSVVAKYFNSEGFLTAEIAVLRDQANIDVFM